MRVSELLKGPLMETLANVEHARWAGWQKYVHECGTTNEDGSITIPADKVAHWSLQIETPYAELSDEEKQSDRDQVLKYVQGIKDSKLDLAVIGNSILFAEPVVGKIHKKAAVKVERQNKPSFLDEINEILGVKKKGE